MTGDSDRLDQIEARVNAATPGPWSAADEHGDLPEADPEWCVSRDTAAGEYWYDVALIQSGDDDLEHDAEFIAHAREDVPWLIGELRDARAEIEELRLRLHDAEAFAQKRGHQLDDSERRGDYARASLADANDEIERLQAELADARAENERLRSRLKRAHASDEEASRQFLAAEAELAAERAKVQRVEKLPYASDDGSEYEHNDGCEGEPTCPACWAHDIRRALAGDDAR